jgi:hypothetical protein
MLTDLLKLQLDLLGARTEFAASLLGGRILARVAPVAAERSPVISIPGLLASDASLLRLNRFLDGQGFRARSWGLGRNLGSQGEDWGPHLARIGQKLSDRVKALADECSRPVSLVGQSLGGVYARELALRMEREIDRVIMLGAPTFHPYKADRHNRMVGAVGHWVNRRSAAELGGRDGLLHWDCERPAMPCVAIHSPIDGIVDEHACHIPGYIVKQSTRKAPRENIRIVSSHVGMSFNPWVMLAIADRLVCSPRRWRPFDPAPYFPDAMAPLLRFVYPRAEGLWRDHGLADFVESRR